MSQSIKPAARRVFVIRTFAGLAATGACRQAGTAPTPPDVHVAATGTLDAAARPSASTPADTGTTATSNADAWHGSGMGGGRMGAGTIGLGNIGTLGYGSGAGGRMGGSRGHVDPTVRMGAPHVVGALPAEVVRRVVLRNLGMFVHCQEQALAQNPNNEGHEVLHFTIAADGTVSASTAAGTHVAVATVHDCIAQAVRRLQFPAPENQHPVTVTYPLELIHPT